MSDTSLHSASIFFFKSFVREQLMNLIIYFCFFHILYLPCSCFVSVVLDPNEGFMTNGKDPVLTVFSAGHALHVFVNGQLSGEEHNVMA